MKLVKNSKFAQRGNLLMQSAVALLIGALSVAGVIYFLGYINSAKTQAIVETMQGFSIAAINESARTVPSPTMTDFLSSNNIPASDYQSSNNYNATIQFPGIPSTCILSANMGSTEIASFNQGAICQFTINGTSDQNQLFATALVKALNAGYVYLAKDMVGTPVKTAADVASFAQPYIIYSDTTGKYSVGTDANFSNFAISNGMLLFGNFATDANIN